jgi:release factor glutamine methyltransferase
VLQAVISRNSSNPNFVIPLKQQRIQKRTNRLLEHHLKSGDNYTVDFYGIQLKMKSEVFCAAYGDGSHALAKQIAVKPGERVLDLGTGSGAMGLVAARQGAEVISVDISPLAVSCATDNARLNGLDDRMTVFQSNLFENLQDEKFSWILFNPPFMDGKPNSPLEMALYDDEYYHLKMFFKEFSNHLLPGGKLLLVFSEAGDLKCLENLMNQTGFIVKMVETEVPEDSQLALVVYELYKGE